MRKNAVYQLWNFGKLRKRCAMPGEEESAWSGVLRRVVKENIHLSCAARLLARRFRRIASGQSALSRCCGDIGSF